MLKLVGSRFGRACPSASFISCTAASLTDSLSGLNTDRTESVRYSPNKQHAMIVINDFEEDYDNSLIFVDLLNRSRIRICKAEWKPLLHAYWLSNDVISVITWNENGHFIHFVYKFGTEEGNVQLELIQKTNIDDDERNTNTALICKYQDPCRMQLKGHECMFACYKNSVYMYVSKGGEELFDRLLKIEIVDFNLISRRIIAKSEHLDSNNINLITLHKKTNSLFTMLGLPHIWQNEQYAVAYERKDELQEEPQTTENRRIIIINLENESVMEKVIEFEFSQVTIYKGFLLFWQVPDFHGKVSFKFEWLGENVPTLKDICSVKMLSQPVKNNQFKQFYKNIMDN